MESNATATPTTQASGARMDPAARVRKKDAAKKKAGAKTEVVEGSKIPALAEWPESETYLEAKEVEPHLRNALDDHDELVNVKFLLQFVKSPFTSRGSQIYARTQIIPEKYRLSLQKDVSIKIAWEKWRGLNDRQKTAFVHRELCGLWRDPDSGVVKTKGPDFVGYYKNLEKYGAWDPGLKELESQVRQIRIPYDGEKKA